MTNPVAAGLKTDLAGLPAMVGTKLGPTEWIEMTQEQVNRFADLIDDHNFIHVDQERARQGPFGGTIAHGFLTLSLVTPVTQLLEVTDAKASINYGLDKVRFPAPLPVGRRWRAQAEVTEVTEVKGGLQAKVLASVEVEGSERPTVAAEVLLRYFS
ncbi:MAG TPA: MaoC family dehydratase [Solirubrobacteraceae bacterium]|nr:MaoC family dehydratase [Solirubrobacteraceae bacterium]